MSEDSPYVSLTLWTSLQKKSPSRTIPSTCLPLLQSPSQWHSSRERSRGAQGRLIRALFGIRTVVPVSVMGTYASYALKELKMNVYPHMKRLFWHLSAEPALWIPAPQLLTLGSTEASEFQENKAGFQCFLSPAFPLVQLDSHGNPSATKILPLQDQNPPKRGLCIPFLKVGPNKQILLHMLILTDAAPQVCHRWL